MKGKNIVYLSLVFLLLSLAFLIITDFYISKTIKIVFGIIYLILLSLFIGLFVYGIYKQKKEVEEIEKGKLLLTVKYKWIDCLSKVGKTISITFAILFLLSGILMIFVENVPVNVLIVIAVSYIVTLFIKREAKIYEKGIQVGLVFYDWRSVESYKCKNEEVTIVFKSNKLFKRKITFKDEKGKIKEILENYIKDQILSII